MNSLKEIKEKVAHDQRFSTWDEYSAMFPVSSVDELAKECWEQCGEYMRAGMELNGLPLLGIPRLND